MSETKDKILKTALHLFAENGYEGVSVSDIAGELGITKGALYRHFKSKRDIFDSITAKMFAADSENSKNNSVPEKRFEENPEEYKGVSPESLKNFTLKQFEFWTEDEFAADFRKMLMLEQFGNPETGKLYQNCLAAGPVEYTKDIFAEMMKNGTMIPGDAESLAVRFYAPVYLLMAIADGANIDRAKLKRILAENIDQFIKEKGLEK